jgi:hypothetical protein
MDARSVAQWIVVVFLMGASFCFPAGASTVHIYSRDFNLPLLDPTGDPTGPVYAMTEAAIEVNNPFIITDLDVQIDITHTHVFDLQLFLQSPNGAWVCLNKYEFTEFFDGENYIDTIFDDEAKLSIEDANAPFTGRFRPEPGYLLGIFDGSNAYGTWRLQIYDMWPSDSGTLDHLELIFSVPEPASALLMTFGATILTVCRRRGHERR